MSHKNWSTSDDGIGHVKDVLRRGGVPLELQARQLANAFARTANGDNTKCVSRNLAYRTSEGVPRELDWLVSYRRKIDIDPIVFDLEFRVIIECKHRQNVEWFTFDVPKEDGSSYIDLSALVLSNAGCSPQLGHALFANNQMSLPEARITALEFKSKSATLFGEPLPMQVAAAAFDYLEFAANRVERHYPFTGPAAVVELRILKRFKSMVSEGVRPQDAITHFLQTLTAQDHQKYLTAIAKSSKQSAHILMALPVLCVNGPLRKVNISDDAEILGFQSTPFAAVKIHLEQWPGGLAERALTTGPGFPILVTSIDSLTTALEYTRGMFGATAYALTAMARSGAVSALPLEIAATGAILEELSRIRHRAT